MATNKKRRKNFNSSLKFEAAQRRNLFYAKIRHICNILGGKELFNMIPNKDLETMYLFRMHAPRFEKAEGNDIPNPVLNEARFLISQQLKNKMVTLLPGSEPISLDEYFTAGITLMIFTSDWKDKNFKNADRLFNAIKPLTDNTDIWNIAWENLYSSMLTFSIFNSSMDHGFYWAKHDFTIRMNGQIGLYNCMYIHKSNPESIRIEVGNDPRPAYKLGWGYTNDGVKWAHPNMSDLGFHKSCWVSSTDVYIQQHAINRLSERLDGIQTGMIHFSLYDSLLNPVVYKSSCGRILIEYRFFQHKLGYLLCELINGKLLIRTFLFLTFSETPEGKKLKERYGIEKSDRMYLSIDKLSSFLTSDIRQNSDIRDLFNKAGCSSLFGIDECFLTDPTTMSKRSPALIITDYLKKRA